MKQLLFAIYVCVCVVSSEDLKIYYRNLINENIEKSLSYKLPTSYEEFRNTPDETVRDIGYFDFIIIGAGSAGSVIAKRLSENLKWTILVIEAGGEETNFTDMVGMNQYIMVSDKNWGFFTTPQNNSCLGRNEKRCFYPRGKSIGGTTAINGAIYSRGSPLNYDFWESEGNDGWSYEDVLPFFKKSERNLFGGDPVYHGFDGPLPVSRRKHESSLVGIFKKGNEQLNVNPIDDYTGRNVMGVSLTQLNQHKGIRYSTGKAFLTDAKAQHNVKVMSHALVTKILINNNTGLAESVQFNSGGKIYVAKCFLEVILSAGAINSPQILMLSGIGPKEHLQELGIEVIKDLPVGKNLKDHVLYSAFNIRSDVVVQPKSLDTIIQEYINGGGKLASPVTASVAFINTDNITDEPPNIQYILLPQEPVSDIPPPPLIASNYNNYFLINYLSKLNATTDFLIGLIFLNEKSSGEVTLKSKSPLDFPLINPNMLTDSENSDIEYIYEGIQFLLELIQTDPFKEINARLVAEIPPCEDMDKYTREYWYCAIKYIATPAYHVTGTTRMGPDAKSAVVNNELLVHGMKNLRVVDAGVIPYPISGHPSAPTMMIAEKISDVIKSKYGR